MRESLRFVRTEKVQDRRVLRENSGLARLVMAVVQAAAEGIRDIHDPEGGSIGMIHNPRVGQPRSYECYLMSELRVAPQIGLSPDALAYERASKLGFRCRLRVPSLALNKQPRRETALPASLARHELIERDLGLALTVIPALAGADRRLRERHASAGRPLEPVSETQQGLEATETGSTDPSAERPLRIVR